MIASDLEMIRVGVVQMAPVWLKREATIEKMISYIDDAAAKGCHLVTFSEALLPGYPFWIEKTDGAKFNSKVQKELHAWYMKEAVQIEAGHLDSLCQLAKEKSIFIVAGIIERPLDRGGHSLYCSLVTIDDKGQVVNVHRKLQPTYEERLSWSPGDGFGLKTQKLGQFTLGGLNCWENWMPLSRAALYAQGEDLHVAVWPGGIKNTIDTAPFLAKEGRSFVLASSGFMRKSDIPDDIPHADLIRQNSNDIISDGGSCIAAPTGEFLVDPVVNEEALLIADCDFNIVREERQNYDPAGHYSRPDVTQLSVNRKRFGIASFDD